MRNESDHSAEFRASGVFVTTHWTQVLAARGESSEAKDSLRELCADYYAPVHAFIRQWRHGADDARDLTHEFFARLLSGHALNHLENGRGRFRSYLLGAVKHFLSDMHDHGQAAKRGAGSVPMSLDACSTTVRDRDDSSHGWEPVDAKAFPPDAFFDGQWALNLLDRVLAVLGREYEQAHQTQKFEALKPYLTGDATSLSPSDAGARLGVSAATAKVAIHRLRRRFRQLVKAEIAATVADVAEVSPELDYLVQALSYLEATDAHAPAQGYMKCVTERNWQTAGGHRRVGIAGIAANEDFGADRWVTGYAGWRPSDCLRNPCRVRHPEKRPVNDTGGQSRT